MSSELPSDVVAGNTTSAAQLESDDVIVESNGDALLPAKKKQKRNKPTLSCEDCVERKTKVSVMRCSDY